MTLFASSCVWAQSNASPQQDSSLGENAPKEGEFEAITSNSNPDVDYTDWLEELTSLSQLPILLPFATPELLREIPTLGPFDRARLSSSTKHGAPLRVGSYLTTSRAQPMMIGLRSRLQVDPNAGDEAGFRNGTFVGSVQKYYDVLRAAVGPLKAELVQSKDPGEARFDDRVNAFVSLRNPVTLGGLTLSQAVLGNFRVAVGTGLIFGDPLSSVKTREAVHATDPHAGGIIAGNRSSALLGAGASVHLDPTIVGTDNDLALSAFGARTPVDAVLDSTGIRTLYNDGYHRTASELAHRQTASLTAVGAHLSFARQFDPAVNIMIGGTASYSALDQAISPNAGSASIGTQYERNLGADLEFISDHIALATEIASSMSPLGTTIAQTVNLQLSPNEEFDIALDYRSVPSGFLTRYGAVFGERTASGGSETGIYAGIDWWILPKNLSLSAYTDLSKASTSSGSASNIPSTPDNFLGLTFTNLGNDVKLHIQYHVKSKEEDGSNVDSTGISLPVTGERRSTSLLLEGSARPLSWLRLEFGAQRVTIGHSASSTADADGTLAYVGARVALSTVLTLDARFVPFNASSYDARLYEYEPNVPGTGDLSPLYGTGRRYAILAEFRPDGSIQISSKYSVTCYGSTRTFGSGATARTGSAESRFSLQADIKF